MARGLDLQTGDYVSAKAAAYPADMNRQVAHVIIVREKNCYCYYYYNQAGARVRGASMATVF